MNRPEPAADAPAFDAPWQAEAFALAVALQDAGVFTAVEWAEALGRERGRPGLSPTGEDYYHSLLDALEGLLARKGLADERLLAETAAAWRRAARATPHGRPIALENDPLGHKGG
ncbi:nitrile hydratase accessory protein [Nitratireductor mangrovi]|uniref:nitrile hydratase accessory protein n=1 Tax=Nitratireductor mangrovi TaxID=2599600 RepID=UPI001FED2D0A|nr:nitrile hydratase accessory protein [Nitratireductor mangrovi]